MTEEIQNNIAKCIENVFAKNIQDIQSYHIKQCVKQYLKGVHVNVYVEHNTYTGSSCNHSCSSYPRGANGIF